MKTISHFSAWTILVLLCGLQYHVTPGMGVAHASCTSPNATGSTFNQTSGLLLSDADGNETLAHYGGGESCSWTVACPNGDKVVLVLTGSMSGASDQVLQIGGTRSFTGSLDSLEVLTLSSTVAVQFTTSNVTDAPSFGLPAGWSAEWRCSATTCASPNATGSVYTAASGTLFSDSDGYGNAVDYAIGQSCSFDIQCPAASGASFIALYPQVEIQSTHVLQVKDTASGALLAALTSSGASGNVVEIVSSTKVTLSWSTTSTSSRRSDRGWTVGYQCVKDRCSASGTPSGAHLIPSSAAATVTSDQDGYGSDSIYSIGESCQWDIDCPVGYQYLRLDYSTGLRSGFDSLTLVDADTRGILHTFSTSAHPTVSGGMASSNIIQIASGGTGRATTMRLAFTSSEFRSASGTSYTRAPSGFTINAKCVPSRCSSPNLTDTTTTNKYSGRFVSDVDGVLDKHLITESELCDWTVQCPLGYDFAVTNLLSNFSESSFLKLQYMDGTLAGPYNASNSSSGFYTSRYKSKQPTETFSFSNYKYDFRTATKGQAKVLSGWSTVQIHFENSKVGTYRTRVYNQTKGSYYYAYKSKTRVGGYTLDWACVPASNPCIADVAGGSNISDSQGMIALDGVADGDATYGVLGAKCSWTFSTCSDGNKPTIKRLDTSSYTSTSWSGNTLTWNGRSISRSVLGGASYLLYQCGSSTNAADLCWSANTSTTSDWSSTLATNSTAMVWSSPGQSVSRYSRVEASCLWKFSCASAQDRIFLNVSGYIGSSGAYKSRRTLLLEDSKGGLIRPYHQYTYASHYTTTLPPGSSARLRTYRNANSIQINATCLDFEACFIPNGTVFDPDASATKEVVILSDRDGANSTNRTTMGARCRYPIKCPSTKSVELRVLGQFHQPTRLSFYNSSGVEIGEKNLMPFYSNRHMQKNYTFPESEVQVEWYSPPEDLLFEGIEVWAKCVSKISKEAVPSSDNVEICNVKHTKYSLSKVGNRINFAPPKNYWSGERNGCVLKIDCDGVDGAHTMVISLVMNQQQSDWNPVRKVFESSSGRLLYNRSGTNSKHASFSYSDEAASDVYVLSALNGNKAVVQLRQIKVTFSFSVFCLTDLKMIPSEKSTWASRTVYAARSSSSSRYRYGQTDQAMSSFVRYNQASSQARSSSSAYDGYRQFYRNSIDEFVVLQCFTKYGIYNRSQSDYSYGPSYRASINSLKGNLKPEATGDRLSFVDGEAGTTTHYSDRSYQSRDSTGITSYAILAHFRSGDSGAEAKSAYGYYYKVTCGSWSQGSDVTASDSSGGGCGYGKYSYNGYCYSNGAGRPSTVISMLVVVLVALSLCVL